MKNEKQYRSTKSLLLVLVVLFSNTLYAKEVSIPFNDININANLELAEGKTLKNGVVIIVHGFMAHNRMEIIEKAQETLSSSGQNSLAINLSLNINNRHGFYDCYDPIQFKLDDALDELDAWILWLNSQGVGKVFLLGHSLSANQVLTYAVKKKPDDVTGIILLAPNTNGYANSPKRYEDKFGFSFDDALEEAKELIDEGKSKQLMEGVDFGRCPMTTVSAESFYTFYWQGNPFWNAHILIPDLLIPILVIAASLDERQPNVEKFIKPLVDNKTVFLEVVDNSGHFFEDLHIEKAVQMAADFIVQAPEKR